MPYLTIDEDQIRAAWDSASDRGDEFSRRLLAEERQDYGRRAVLVHLPQRWPHGIYCHNCGHTYPCWVAVWGMGLLKAEGWNIEQVLELVLHTVAGQQSRMGEAA